MPFVGLLTSGFLQEADVSGIYLAHDDGHSLPPVPWHVPSAGAPQDENADSSSPPTQPPISIKSIHHIHPLSTAYLLGTSHGGLILYDSSPPVLGGITTVADAFNPYRDFLSRERYVPQQQYPDQDGVPAGACLGSMHKFRVVRRFESGLPLGAQSSLPGAFPAASSLKASVSEITGKKGRQSPFQLQFGAVTFVSTLRADESPSVDDDVKLGGGHGAGSGPPSSHAPPHAPPLGSSHAPSSLPPIVVLMDPSDTIYIVPSLPTSLDRSLARGAGVLHLPATADRARVTAVAVRRTAAAGGGVGGELVTDIMISGDDSGSVRLWPLCVSTGGSKVSLASSGYQSFGAGGSANGFKSRVDRTNRRAKKPAFETIQAHRGLVSSIAFVSTDGKRKGGGEESKGKGEYGADYGAHTGRSGRIQRSLTLEDCTVNKGATDSDDDFDESDEDDYAAGGRQSSRDRRARSGPRGRRLLTVEALRTLSVGECEVTSICFFTFGGGVNGVQCAAGTASGSLYLWGRPASETAERSAAQRRGGAGWEEDFDGALTTTATFTSASEAVLSMKLLAIANHTDYAVTHLEGVEDDTDEGGAGVGLLLAGDGNGVIRLYRGGEASQSHQQQEDADEGDKAQGTQGGNKRPLVPIAEVKVLGPTRAIVYEESSLKDVGRRGRGTILVACEGGEICHWNELDLPVDFPPPVASYASSKRGSGKGKGGGAKEEEGDDEKYREAYVAFAEEDGLERPTRAAADISDADELLRFARDRKASFVERLVGSGLVSATSADALQGTPALQKATMGRGISFESSQQVVAPSPNGSSTVSSSSPSGMSTVTASSPSSSMSSPPSARSYDKARGGNYMAAAASTSSTGLGDSLLPRSAPPPLPSPPPRRPGGGLPMVGIAGGERGLELKKMNELTSAERLAMEKAKMQPPLGRRVEEAREIMAVAEEAGVKVGVDGPFHKPHPLAAPVLNSTLHYQNDFTNIARKKFDPNLVAENEDSKILAARQTTNFGRHETVFKDLVQIRGDGDESVSITLPERRVEKQVSKGWLNNLEAAKPTPDDLLPKEAEPVVRLGEGEGASATARQHVLAAEVLRLKKGGDALSMGHAHVRRGLGAY